MKYDKAFQKLKSSQKFKNWEEENKEAYLAHFFTKLDEDIEPLNWEIAYYHESSDSMTTFAINEEIEVEPEADVFKKKDKVKELPIEKVSIDLQEAIEKAQEVQEENYPQHPPLKGLTILQNIEEGTVWNITLITQSFNTLNVKINAEDGTVEDHNISTLFDMSEGDNPLGGVLGN